MAVTVFLCRQDPTKNGDPLSKRVPTCPCAWLGLLGSCGQSSTVLYLKICLLFYSLSHTQFFVRLKSATGKGVPPLLHIQDPACSTSHFVGLHITTQLHWLTTTRISTHYFISENTSVLLFMWFTKAAYRLINNVRFKQNRIYQISCTSAINRASNSQSTNS